MSEYSCPMILVVFTLGISLAPPSKDSSWTLLFWRIIASALGVVAPVAVFFGSMLLMPAWRGAAQLGWIDCLHCGKIALAPLVVWAAAALYALEIWQTQRRTQPWLVLGLFMGSLVSIACFVYGIIIARAYADASFVLLIPFYMAAWYTYRAIGLAKEAALSPLTYLLTLTGSLPFWVSSVVIAKTEYLGLPDEPPDCFVVSAALNGHERIVRPFVLEDSSGRTRQVNLQLLAFWRFEKLWTAVSPQTHGWFRSIYGIVGPMIAARIRTAWAADIVYLLLKPAELAARGMLRLAGQHRHCAGDDAGLFEGDLRNQHVAEPVGAVREPPLQAAERIW